MNKTLLRSVAFFAALVITLSACKKDKAGITKEDLAGSYQLLKMTFTAAVGGGEQDITIAALEDCELDNIITLEADGDYIMEDAGDVCDPNGSEQGEWALVAGNKIEIEGQTSDIVSFSGGNLVVSVDDEFFGVAGKLKTYLKKK